jgi:hypothetical protein
MGGTAPEVGGLPLPEPLLAVLDQGRWQPPADETLLARVFGDEPDWASFYDLPTMRHQNRSFQSGSADEHLPGIYHQGLGIEPGRAVIIGDLGADMPFALDYRAAGAGAGPRVLYFGPDGWVEVAPDFATLARALGIQTG